MHIRLNFDCSFMTLNTSLHKSVWAPPNNYLHVSAIFRKGVKTQMILWRNLYVTIFQVFWVQALYKLFQELNVS